MSSVSPASAEDRAEADRDGIDDPGTAALWPTASQQRLLEAAVLEGPTALVAWEEWKTQHDLVESELDHGSFRLLPLVYRNLLAQRANEPEMPRLKGIYRYWWCSNQRLFYRAAQVVEACNQAGIRTLVLKGTALATQFYRDAGARPMGDIDVLVPYADARSAVAHLGRHGWYPIRPRVGDLIRYQHCVGMTNETGERLDLHWHVLRECVDQDTDRLFWRRAVPVRVHHTHSLALGPTDALFHAVVHGMRWNQEPTVRWIADAMAILRTAQGEIDWTMLRDEARERRMVLRVLRGLSYLRHRLAAPIPDAALDLLRRAPVTSFEQVEYRMLTFGSDRKRGIRPSHLVVPMVQYLRFVSGMNLGRRLTETPSYLRYRLRGRRGPVFDAIRGMRRRFRRLVGPPVASRETR